MLDTGYRMLDARWGRARGSRRALHRSERPLRLLPGVTHRASCIQYPASSIQRLPRGRQYHRRGDIPHAPEVAGGTAVLVVHSARAAGQIDLDDATPGIERPVAHRRHARPVDLDDRRSNGPGDVGWRAVV